MKKYFNIIIASLAVTALGACHKAENARISQPVVQVGNIIKSDTLSGSVKGTLLSGKTYYFASNITVNGGDTLLMQPGSKLIALGDGVTAATAPEIFVHGTFISLGTQQSPNYITVRNADDLHTQASNQNYTNVFFGWWGGITCTPATPSATNANPQGGDCIVKWTHIEFGGGPAGANDNAAIYPSGTARFNIY